MPPDPKFKTPEELDAMIEKYFEHCKAEKDWPTTAGLALFLGFCSRQSLYDYKEREAFSYSIKRALSHIESHHERNLNNMACAGSIFWLKNHRWSDKQELQHTGADGGPLKISVEFVK